MRTRDSGPIRRALECSFTRDLWCFSPVVTYEQARTSARMLGDGSREILASKWRYQLIHHFTVCIVSRLVVLVGL